MKQKIVVMVLVVGLFLGFSNCVLAGEKGLVGYWKFDEGKGDIAKDLSGKGNNGIINGAKWVKGKSGTALQFDGVDNYVDCGNDNSLDITDAITIEAWFKLNSLSTAESKGADDHVIVRKDSAYCLYDDWGSLRLHLWGTPERKVLYSNRNIQTGRWYHLVGTYDKDGGDNNLKLYLNGVEVAFETATGSIPVTTRNLGMGTNAHNESQYFNGTIDKVRIYNRALSAEEIKRHYQECGGVIVKENPRYKVKIGRYFKDRPSNLKNLVENSSFEVGQNKWKGIMWKKNPSWKEKVYTDMKGVLEIDNSQAVHGGKSMRINVPSSSAYYPSNEPPDKDNLTRYNLCLTTEQILVDPEKEYTFSFYMKADRKIGVKCLETNFSINKDWRRYQAKKKLSTIWPYNSKHNTCRVYFSFFGEPGTVWLDAVQLEEGSLTSYQLPESLDIGVDADKRMNLYKEGEPITLSVNLFNGTKDNLSPKVDYKIIDFFDKIVKEGKLSYKLDSGKGNTKTIKLSLNKKGYFKGIFTIKDRGISRKEEIHLGIFSPFKEDKRDKDSFFCMNSTGSHFGGSDFDLSLMKNLGVKGTNPVRVAWPEIMTKEGALDQKAVKMLDEVLNRCKKHNLDVQVNFGGIAPWVSVKRSMDLAGGDAFKWASNPENWTPEYTQAWSDYVYQVVNHFKDKIKYWMVALEFIRETNVPVYVKMLKTAYLAAKRADPDCKIGGLGPYSCYRMAGDVKRVFEAGGFDYLDIVALDPYVGVQGPAGENFDKNLDKINSLIKQYGGGKEVWVQEMGWKAADTYYKDFCMTTKYAYTVTEPAQAEYIVRANVIALSRGVKRFYTWCLDEYSAMWPPYPFGIVHHNYSSPKPAYLAYSAMTNQLKGARFIREIHLGKLIRAYQFEKDNQPLIVIWNVDIERMEAMIKLPISPEKLKVMDLMGNPVPLKGKDNLTITLTGAPLYLKCGKMSSKEVSRIFNKAEIETPGLMKGSIHLNRKKKEILISLKNETDRKQNGKISLVLPENWKLSLTGTNEISQSYQSLKPGEERLIRFSLKKIVITPAKKFYRITSKITYDKGEKKVVSDVSDTAISCYYTSAPLTIDGDLSDWKDTSFTYLGKSQVIRWGKGKDIKWQGPEDLSARFATKWDKDNLYLGVEVEDDKHIQNYPEEKIWDGDCMQIGIDSMNDALYSPGVLGYDQVNDYEYSFLLTKKGSLVFQGYPSREQGFKFKEEGMIKTIKCAIKRRGKKTYYEIAMPFSCLKPFTLKEGKTIAFNIVVLDNDGEGMKGWLELTKGVAGGKNPSLFKDLILIKESNALKHKTN